jgi:hypothetical protein
MGTILASAIVDKAERILLDETNVRWTAQELLGYLNDGQRLVVLHKPDAHVKNEAVKLAAGTKQAIPAGGIKLIRVVRNMGTVDGTTPGKAVRWADMAMLDVNRPDWHADSASAVVDHFLFDPLDHKNFYVTPPQPTSDQGYVELIYSAAPADVELGAAIALDDVYKDPLFFATMWLAHSKETSEANSSRASAYYELFIQSITGKTAGESAVNVATQQAVRAVRQS